MAFYNKTDSDALKTKFADLSRPTGADFSALVDHVDSALKGLDDSFPQIITQSQYDALTDKTGLYVIQG